MSAKKGERLLGPYKERAGWRVIEVYADGTRKPIVFPTEAKATRYIEVMSADLAKEDHTTETALAEYKRHLADEGHKPQSVRAIEFAIKMLLPEPITLSMLTPTKAEALYKTLRTEPNKTTKQPPSVDTHRNALTRTKVFLSWCAAKPRCWIRANPFAEVKGVGRKRPRGKSLGKSGNELRVKEARAWYTTALALACAGDEGAVAALVALLLGMRAHEIVSRRVADLESYDELGDALWIPCSKTPAGRRTLEVPDVLRPLLLARCEGRAPERYLFEATGKLHAGKPHPPYWLLRQVHRICDAASSDTVKVPKVTTHSMRGLLATLSAERGMAAHLIAATLGHENVSTTMTNYAAPGSASAGARALGLKVLNGGRSVA